MKTDEIIKGLRACSSSSGCRKECPYYQLVSPTCIQKMTGDAADLIEKLMEEHSWVSTSERLPEDGQEVIAILDDGSYALVTNDFDGFADNHNHYSADEVRAWMPKPEPPEVNS